MAQISVLQFRNYYAIVFKHKIPFFSLISGHFWTKFSAWVCYDCPDSSLPGHRPRIGDDDDDDGGDDDDADDDDGDDDDEYVGSSGARRQRSHRRDRSARGARGARGIRKPLEFFAIWTKFPLFFVSFWKLDAIPS